MVDKHASPKLKRKREGAELSRKKVKTHKKSGEGEEDAAIPPAKEVKAERPELIPVDETLKEDPTSSDKEAGKRSEQKAKKRKSTGDTTNDVAEVQDTIAPAPAVQKSEDLPNDTNEQKEIPRKQSRGKKRNKQKNRGKQEDNDVDMAIADGSYVAKDTGNVMDKVDVIVKSESALAQFATDGESRPKKKGKKKEPRKGRSNAAEGILSAGRKHEEERRTDETVTIESPPVEQSKQSKKTATIKEEDTSTVSSILAPQSLRQSKEKKRKSQKAAQWSVSPPLGGWFLSQEPIFSSDEKFLILANGRALEIYSTETSLLASSLSMGSSFVSAYSLSSTNPKHIYTANSTGLITLWDWTERRKIARWDIGTNVQRITVVPQPESKQDLVYCHEVGTSHVVNVHALRTKEHQGQTELKNILKSKSPISGVQVLLEGKIVVIATHKSLLIGKRTKLQKTALQDFEYTWREVLTSKRITTFSAYVRTQAPSAKGKQTSQDPRDHLDLAIGDQEGVIYLFEDIISSFAQVEKSQKGDTKAAAEFESLRPKRLHWHREAVGSLKWSRDGNYLISGGGETVLVLWQLSTGQQQHLPHLTAAIENIVVSPTGSSYAITLANNSVVVLSTSELEAKTNIIGIQSRRVDLERLPRETSSSQYSFDIFNEVPFVVDPKNNNQVLFSVPSSQPRHHNARSLPEPYMQTVDVTTQRAVARQPLTRNNATDPNMGPEGRRIKEPSIKFLRISHDGEWLATIDEWVPPRTDMGYLDEGIPEFNEEERIFRREVYLKFWRWDEKKAQWTLESRIDAPHFLDTVGASARVLDLVADPVEVGFVTVGEDRYVRTWRPKTRKPDGTTTRGANKSDGLVTWSLDRLVELNSSLDVLEAAPSNQASLLPQTARLGFSSDGSVLAAGVSFASESDSGVIHIIDSSGGYIRRSITELDVTALSCLGIVGHYLVVVSDSIIVWDIVSDELVSCTSFETPGVDRFERVPLVRLAIDEDNGTFAVAWPRFDTNNPSKSRGTRYFKKASSKISIFDPLQQQPLWSSIVADIVLSLASARTSKAYIMLDASSCITLVSPKARVLQLPTPPLEAAAQIMAEEQKHDDLEEDDLSKHGTPLEMLMGSEDIYQDSENDKPVVRPEQLQEIFDVGPSHALPPVKDLLNAVVGLYARKPRAIGVA